MSPSWAQVVANGIRSPRTQSNVVRNPELTALSERSICTPNPGKIKATRLSQPDPDTESICRDPLEIEDETHINGRVIMDQTQDAIMSPLIEASAMQTPEEHDNDTPSSPPAAHPRAVSQMAPAPCHPNEHFTIETQDQLHDKIYDSLQTETLTQVVDDHFQFPLEQEQISHMLCADAFCRHHIPQTGIKGRWATCQACQQKTCVNPSCGLLERSHLNRGWEICPDGAAAMGLERLATARRWRRCEGCHRFLVKTGWNGRWRSAPCEECTQGQGEGEGAQP